MTGRAMAAMAWALAAVALMLFAFGVLLGALGSSTRGPHLGTPDILFFAASLSYAVVGATVASRRPGNAIGWLLLAEGVLLQIVCFSIGYTHFAVYAESGRLPGGRYVAWAGNSIWIPIVVVALFVVLLFPTGHLRSPRWRPVAGVGLLLAAAGFASDAFEPGSMGGSLADMDNPLGIPGAGRLLSTLGAVSAAIAVPLLLGAALLSFALRFREADAVQRHQLRWLAYAALMLVAGFVVGDILQELGLPSLVHSFCYLLPLAGLPVAIGVAILRHRLYDIEVIIDGTVIVTAVAGFAALVYAATVVGVGAVVGDRTGSNVVLTAVATAVVALGFQPVLRWARRLGRRIAYGTPAPHEQAVGLAIRCLGAFRMFRDGRPVPATAWQSKKARTLLKILIARRGRSTPRALLMEELWPEDDPAKLSNRLSVALATARGDPDKAYAADHHIAADKDAMRLDLGHIALDVEDFLARATSGLSLSRDRQPDQAAPVLTAAAAMPGTSSRRTPTRTGQAICVRRRARPTSGSSDPWLRSPPRRATTTPRLGTTSTSWPRTRGTRALTSAWCSRSTSPADTAKLAAITAATPPV